MKNKNKNFPHFPANSYWKNHTDIVNKRKRQLADYLNTLCREADIINDDECCNFFHIQSKTAHTQ